MPKTPPTHLLGFAARSRAMFDHGLTERAFETLRVPLDQLSDADRLRVARWAAGRGLPATVTRFRLKRHLWPDQTADLFA